MGGWACGRVGKKASRWLPTWGEAVYFGLAGLLSSCRGVCGRDEGIAGRRGLLLGLRRKDRQAQADGGRQQTRSDEELGTRMRRVAVAPRGQKKFGEFGEFLNLPYPPSRYPYFQVSDLR